MFIDLDFFQIKVQFRKTTIIIIIINTNLTVVKFFDKIIKLEMNTTCWDGEVCCFVI